jgi:S-formylglutathione hydrolase FrmB
MYMHSRKSLIANSRTTRTLLSITAVLTLFSQSAMAMGKKPTVHQPQCASYFSNILSKSVEYCIDRSTPDAPYAAGEPITYFFHGTNGNAKTWMANNYAYSLDQMRQSGKILPAMTFVSFNTSPYSFFVDHPYDKNSAYETWFLTEFIPYIENLLPVCNHKECRAVMGESMGGFGALKTILRHPDMFSEVAVNSPALPPFSVRDSIAKWEWFFTHHTVGPVKGLLLIELVRHILPTEESWDVQDPIQLTENYPADQTYPPIYFDMGGRDGYGFNVGYEILKGIFDKRGIPYATNFEPKRGHDMWKRHAGDAIQFIFDHLPQSE